MSTAYYNEIDPYAAQWLRNLIDAGHIAPGIVDERSIEDVYPSDLRGFTQCHFFAGIGVWSYALRAAGWGDDRPVWTGSCPCQPFSAAGKGAGFDDARHLWPHFGHLIKECEPAIILGEQVASKDVDPWIDLVCADLEALGYAVGAVPFPSAGIGAPHIRDRCYWVADADSGARTKGRSNVRGRADRSHAQPRPGLGRSSMSGGVAHAGRIAAGRETQAADHVRQEADGPTDQSGGRGGASCGMADTDGGNAGAERKQRSGEQRQQPEDGLAGGLANSDFARFCGEQGLRLQGATFHDADGRSPVGGFWADAEWIPCRDGKWRPVEPGTSPLAHGAPARMGRLRAYGNAVNAEAAIAWAETVMEAV